ncbi:MULTISPECIES: ABC transporter ATP-binding protein [unclassified Thiomonas]|uniref:ABC transporter ATP-binding protein n=1 Tax=unclassified Thiomonas TaxID=2625466 RepID=UPI0004DBA4E9|nr:MULTISPECIES: ABC transporter ATP-binding protein [unclassified Thiomonas]CDW92748.1 Efflux ABC transporter, ATP-binding protein [Thiomonas sp. CB2]VDY05550.1 ABC-type polysaccharide/polyol phosphate transport system, ATPase component [Thiomonas sp. Bio17B3]VDY07286.1 ABC-type polysaccharide/polyol phosphate transport system, ATPase component [Thiomonas sp. Sup16B3]VDY13804.1 Efflux ABC transporter, ATP-binding protein [Thiomonas sp. OC7]VDY16996.1 Efflux ABC transporter, ATP-binding protei
MSAVDLIGVSKTYSLYRHGIDRLLEVVSGKKRHTEFFALHPLDLHIAEGEVLGLVGMNGAGKSTLLKLLAHTLTPTTGTIKVQGRVSALLELGTGFHPEMTGRENVYLSAAVLGIARSQIEALYDEIVDFSGLHDFMEQPVKTYSSGMFVRLAFAVATCVNPDVLIVDEALSVGDGAFARKSFDRIMGFKKAGKTILFCSHSLYQVEAICSRVIWVHQGRVMMDGDPAQVVAAYNGFLNSQGRQSDGSQIEMRQVSDAPVLVPAGHARLTKITVAADGQIGKQLQLRSLASDLCLQAEFSSDPVLPVPTVAFAITGPDGRWICSAGSLNDGVVIQRQADGSGQVSLTFSRLSLLKGEYDVQVFLLSEDGVHIYDQANDVARLQVTQTGLEQGIVAMPHSWATGAAEAVNPLSVGLKEHAE